MSTQLTTINPMFGLYLYPEAIEFRNVQQDNFWTSQEIPVDKDKQQYLIEMSEHKLSVCKHLLQGFVEIEQTAGGLWERIAKWFPHSEIEMAISSIASMEISVHAPFYQKMSDVLLIDPKETARVQQEVTAIANKLTLLKDILTKADDNKLVTLAVLSLIEQVLLFGNFALLKSFGANGYNEIPNTLFGLSFVIFDETIHGEFASYLYHTYKSELQATGDYNDDYFHSIESEVVRASQVILDHEDATLSYIFKDVESDINSVTEDSIKSFLRSRTNTVYDSLGITGYSHEVTNDTVSSWFFKDIKASKMHDFFNSGTSEYTREWDEQGFSLLEFIGDINDNK